jgi:hypothetical protein
VVEICRSWETGIMATVKELLFARLRKAKKHGIR